jgi:hypothetical protein
VCVFFFFFHLFASYSLVLIDDQRPQAMASEERAKQKASTFPPFLAKAVLQAANLYNGAQPKVAAHVRAALNSSLVVGEHVEARFSESFPSFVSSFMLAGREE